MNLHADYTRDELKYAFSIAFLNRIKSGNPNVIGDCTCDLKVEMIMNGEMITIYFVNSYLSSIKTSSGKFFYIIARPETGKVMIPNTIFFTEEVIEELSSYLWNMFNSGKPYNIYNIDLTNEDSLIKYGPTSSDIEYERLIRSMMMILGLEIQIEN